MSNTKDVDSVVEAVFEDLPEPSPVADVPHEYDSPAPEAPAADAPKKRGRPRKEPLAGGAIPKTARPKIEGVKAKTLDTTPAPSPGVEPAANVATAMIAMSGIALGGQEAAMTQQEAVLVNNTFIHYFTIKGIDSVPAWVILAGGLAPYYMRVLATPPARSKVSVLFGAFGRGVKNIYLRIVKGKKNDARVDSRANDDRQDNPSKKDGR
ncbi:MAG: hypothetical protein ACK5QX_04075 [bacterium]|jgi:hypothetical protein